MSNDKPTTDKHTYTRQHGPDRTRMKRETLEVSSKVAFTLDEELEIFCPLSITPTDLTLILQQVSLSAKELEL